MYEPSIEVVMKQMRTKFDNEIYQAVQEYGVVVDKEELIRALRYDRDQYENGYADGLAADKWISVEDRLPDKDGRYLVAMKNGNEYHISTRKFKVSPAPVWWKGHSYGSWARLTGGVRFWAMLPEPPTSD